MNRIAGTIAAVCALTCGALFAGVIRPTDHVAVAETANKGGLSAETVDAFADMLESEIDVGRLITRSGLKQMMTEIGFATSSDLLEPNSPQVAQLGKVKGVKYLVLTSVAKVGSRYQLIIRVVDSSTGEVLRGCKASQPFRTIDDLADALPGVLTRIGLKESAGASVGTAPGTAAPAAPAAKTAVLTPLIKVAAPPDYLKENLNVYLEGMLIANGISLLNLKSVDPILRRNGIGELDQVEPVMWQRVGQLLGVDRLVQVTINRFTVSTQSQTIAVTRQTVTTTTGVIEGNVRIVSAQTGEIVASFPIEQPASLPGGVDASDYGRNLLKAVIEPLALQLVPVLKR